MEQAVSALYWNVVSQTLSLCGHLLHCGRWEDVLPLLPDNSIDSFVTDPPYGIRFMGKAWDGKNIDYKHAQRQAIDSRDPYLRSSENASYRSAAVEAGKYNKSLSAMHAFEAFSQEWGTEVLRVLKPGGHLLAFASPRTYHRMVCGIEDAGFEVRECVLWVFGQGFPKSKNGPWGGSALKPAYEPVLMARKPLGGTYEEAWRLYGTGGLNIDACRVEHVTVEGGNLALNPHLRTHINGGNGGHIFGTEINRRVVTPNAKGRWPSNLIHDGSDEVRAAFPNAKGQQGDLKKHNTTRQSPNGIFGGMRPALDHPARVELDTNASRFFYCPKVSAKERNAGLDDAPDQVLARSEQAKADAGRGITVEKAGGAFNKARVVKNNHPTVKPIALMDYLIRLVTPPGGIVVDPFAGSGSTGIAALRGGFRFIGVDEDQGYFNIMQARIAAAAAEI